MRDFLLVRYELTVRDTADWNLRLEAKLVALLLRLDIADLTGENRSFSEHNSSPGIEANLRYLRLVGFNGLYCWTKGRLRRQLFGVKVHYFTQESQRWRIIDTKMRVPAVFVIHGDSVFGAIAGRRTKMCKSFSKLWRVRDFSSGSWAARMRGVNPSSSAKFTSTPLSRRCLVWWIRPSYIDSFSLNILGVVKVPFMVCVRIRDS